MSLASFKNRASANPQNAWVDLATIEGNVRHLYTGKDCVTPFSREPEKSSWFSTIWAPMRQDNSNEDNPSWRTHNNVDMLLKVLWRATVPAVKLKDEFSRKGYQIAFTRNLAHNAIGQVELLFNDLRTQSFDSVYLDCYANHFTKGYDKWLLYNRMIGNIPEAVEWSQNIPSFDIKALLPFSFTKGPTEALKLCCLKLVQTRFAFHSNTELGRLIRMRRPLGRDKNGVVQWEDVAGDVSEYLDFEDKKNRLQNVELWAKYAIVTDEERDFHKLDNHAIILEQSLNYDHVETRKGSGPVNAQFHWNGAVKSIMFACLNRTATKYNSYSNYTTNARDASQGRDPLKTMSLQYDSQYRYQNIPADLFSEVEAMEMPNAYCDTGHHILNYSLDPANNTPNGVTVFDRLISSFSVDIEDKQVLEGDERELRLNPANEYSLVLRGIGETLYLISGNSISIPIGGEN